MATRPSGTRRLALLRGALIFASLILGLAVAEAGDSADYYWDEMISPGSSYHYCKGDNQCDGKRTCNPFGWCQGEARKAEEAHWGYNSDAKGPENWGDMSRDFAVCKLGKEQSPINIQTDKTIQFYTDDATDAAIVKNRFPPILFHYNPDGRASVVNNGHTIQVDLPDGGGGAVFGSQDFKLRQFHFHAPSEEQVNGEPFAMVAHLVHQNTFLDYIVVAVLFKSGKENLVLKPVFDNMPAKKGDPSGEIAKLDPTGFLPNDRKYYAYLGSLTTPPCSEGVSWYVLKEPVELSPEQINAFRLLYSMNARPIQPTNDRRIFEAN
jgi:carbonic anhydrase